MDPNPPSGDEGSIYRLSKMSLDLSADIQIRDAKLIRSQESFIECHALAFQELHGLEKAKPDKNADELREMHASLAKSIKDVTVISKLIALHINKLMISYDILKDLNETLCTLLQEKDSAKADKTTDELTHAQISFPRSLTELRTMLDHNAHIMYDLQAAYDKLKKENEEFYLPCVQEKSATESASAESESSSKGQSSSGAQP